MHYQKAKRGGLITVPRWSHSLHRKPKGTGKHLTQNGYVRIRLEPYKWMLEHRHVMEQRLGRALLPRENVHHINGDRTDNRDENLELWLTMPQPQGIRIPDAITWAREILARYG